MSKIINETASSPPPPKKKPSQNDKTIGHYILGKSIGEGTFGKVKLGTHTLTQEKVAVKILEKCKIVDVADVERVSREIHILKIVRHPQVVQLYEIIETQKKLYLIMEYASGGELFDYIVQVQRVKEKEACRFFQQIIAGVEYISRLNVVHRDLKPENLLLDYDRGIKLVDFGLSNTYKQSELLKTACGSPCYAAPEMIAGKKYHGTNVDIWSCGVILFALICGYLPFEDPNTSQLYKKILGAEFQVPKFVSDEAKDLIACILNTDPEKRYKIEDIRKHPWFSLVKCEENFQGTIVGIDQVPIDPEILQSLTSYDIDIEYARKCLEANKHNHITATYYLLLKKHLKSGGESIADPRSPKYNPNYFFRRQPGFAKLTTAPAIEETMEGAEQKTSTVVLDQQSKKNRLASLPPAPTRLRRIADGLIDMERYTPNGSNSIQYNIYGQQMVTRSRRRAESTTPNNFQMYNTTNNNNIQFQSANGGGLDHTIPMMADSLAVFQNQQTPVPVHPQGRRQIAGSRISNGFFYGNYPIDLSSAQKSPANYTPFNHQLILQQTSQDLGMNFQTLDIDSYPVQSTQKDYLATLEAQAVTSNNYSRRRSKSKNSGGNAHHPHHHQRNMTQQLNQQTYDPMHFYANQVLSHRVDFPQVESYTPFSLLKQTVSNLEAYGMRPRTKVSNQTMEVRASHNLRDPEVAQAHAEIYSHLNTNLNARSPPLDLNQDLVKDDFGVSEMTKASMNRLGIFLPSQRLTMSPKSILEDNETLKSQISSAVRSRRYKKGGGADSKNSSPKTSLMTRNLKNIYKATPQPVGSRGPINSSALHQNYMQNSDSLGPDGNLTLSDFIGNNVTQPKRPLKTSVGMATSTAMTSGSHLLFDQSLLLSGQVYLHNKGFTSPLNSTLQSTGLKNTAHQRNASLQPQPQQILNFKGTTTTGKPFNLPSSLLSMESTQSGQGNGPLMWQGYQRNSGNAVGGGAARLLQPSSNPPIYLITNNNSQY